MINSVAGAHARQLLPPHNQHLARGGVVTSRLRRVALLTLALLIATSIAAGGAVAHLLPARLARFQIPRVAGYPLAAAGQVLPAAGQPPGQPVTPGGLTARLSGTLGVPALGGHVTAVVASLPTGQVLFARDGSSPSAPASTAKLATAVAALHVLGPAARLSTRVVAGRGRSAIVLIGGGDPTLAAGRPPASDYPQPATLATLAARTARALRAGRRRTVRLGYDGSLLASHGIRVRGPVRPAAAPGAGVTIASVASPPLAQIVQWMLIESNNVIAENLARQVAIAAGGPATFSGGAAAVTTADRQLGVRGIHLVDGSGLSPDDRISSRALVQLITVAARHAEPGLRPAITGLPVAGFSGTLAPGGSVFDAAGRPALGVVRAKTGNLTSVAALAGVAYARNGQLLAFAFMADHVPRNALGQAGRAIDKLATELAACGCR